MSIWCPWHWSRWSWARGRSRSCRGDFKRSNGVVRLTTDCKLNISSLSIHVRYAHENIEINVNVLNLSTPVKTWNPATHKCDPARFRLIWRASYRTGWSFKKFKPKDRMKRLQRLKQKNGSKNLSGSWHVFSLREAKLTSSPPHCHGNCLHWYFQQDISLEYSTDNTCMCCIYLLCLNLCCTVVQRWPVL